MSVALTQTTLSAALAIGNTVATVASATNLSSPTNGFYQKIYVINPGQTRGELMSVLAVNGTSITLGRIAGPFRQSFASGALVVIANVDPTIPGFYDHDPDGAPSTAPYVAAPWLNVVNGNQWIPSASGNIWTPGWGNPSGLVGEPTTLVASAAGSVVPTGRLFHINGTAAITGFTIASMIGFAGGRFTVIPDAVFTWTAAGNIALAGTAVVSKALDFVWDPAAVKWYPSYIA